MVFRRFRLQTVPRAILQQRRMFSVSMRMQAIKYTDQHEWIDEDTGRLGITDHAQQELGDVVFVELPAIGDVFSQGDSIAAIESVKAASDVYAPISGEVVAINEHLETKPGTLNKSPMEEGWIVQLKPTDSSEFDGMLSEDDYLKIIE